MEPIPCRRYLKQVTALQPLKTFEKNAIRAFTAGTGVDILIVVDKLLTGFDAPRNQTLYLAKELREHKLLQAIARVNRLFASSEEDELGRPLHEKEHGRIIDYVGSLGNLDQALTDYREFEGYDESDVAEAMLSLYEEAKLLPDRHAALLDLFKGIGNAIDMEAYQLHLRAELTRKRFYDRLSAFARTLQIAFSCQQWIDETKERVIANYKADLKRFEELRRAVRLRYGDADEDYDYRRYQAAKRPRLKVDDMELRWGSYVPASHSLVLNHVLVQVPVPLIDYVITHEICHIPYPNHGPEFDRLLTKIMPDHALRKAKLELVFT